MALCQQPTKNEEPYIRKDSGWDYARAAVKRNEKPKNIHIVKHAGNFTGLTLKRELLK